MYNEDNEMNEYNKLCSRSIDRTAKRFCITIAVIIMTVGSMMIAPTYDYMKYGKRTTLFSSKIPFVDEDWRIGFGVHY